MNKKDIRLIGLDLDGTTLTSDKVLTPHTKEVLESCLRQGIQILPATGRARSGIPDYLTEIEGIRYVVVSNGAAVVDLETGENVYTNCISWERALEIFDILEEYHTFYDIYALGKDGLWQFGFHVLTSLYVLYQTVVVAAICSFSRCSISFSCVG